MLNWYKNCVEDFIKLGISKIKSLNSLKVTANIGKNTAKTNARAVDIIIVVAQSLDIFFESLLTSGFNEQAITYDPKNRRATSLICAKKYKNNITIIPNNIFLKVRCSLKSIVSPFISQGKLYNKYIKLHNLSSCIFKALFKF